MKKFFLFLCLPVFLLVLLAGSVSAQETSVEAQSISAADLGVEEPGLLPSSPFYFFKEIGRGLQRALTFDAVAKIELELKIASEKAAEAKKVAEQQPNNERAIARALANYERAQERLRSRLAALQETSENPNIDRLLDMIAERQVVHERLLDDLQAKHDTQKNAIQNIRTRIQETFEEIAERDLPERFRERLENAFDNSAKGTLQYLRSLEITDRLLERDNISDQTKERLRDLRSRLQDRAQEHMQDRRDNSSAPSSSGGEENTDVVCTMEYAPVCGVDGKTYSNRCVAEQQNKVRVAHEGECESDNGNGAGSDGSPGSTERNYQGRSVEECRRIQLLCVEGFRRFDDNTGCGCERVESSSGSGNSDSATAPPPTSTEPTVRNVTLDADDFGFYPSNEIRVAQGTRVRLTFNVSEQNVYYAGLDFRSPKFETSRIDPGQSTTVEFVADESFEFKSYWPASGVLKATGRVIVE